MFDSEEIYKYCVEKNELIYFEEGYDPIFKWLKSGASVEDRHYLATNGNWDFVDVSIFHYIISREDCDLSTALSVFFLAQPLYYIENGLSGRDLTTHSFYTIIMLTDIRIKFLDGFYKTKLFEFNFEEFGGDDFKVARAKFDWIEEFIPLAMEQNISGKILDYRPDWEDGLPPETFGN